MPVYGAFTPSTLGMLSQTRALNTLASNIANINTGGFKGTDTRFATVLSKTMPLNAPEGTTTAFGSASSDFGGVRAIDFQRIDRQGTLISSSRDLDVAISGKGFFVLNTQRDRSGDTLYTRDGSFSITPGPDTTALADDGTTITVKEGYLVDKNGYYVQGLTPDTNGIFTPGGGLSSLRVDQFAFASTGRATTTSKVNLNLPAGDATGSTQVFTVEVFDSLFASQNVDLNFTKGTAANTWSFAATVGQTPTAQVDTVTIAGTIEAGDRYDITVNSTTVTYTVTGLEGTLDGVRDAIVAAVNANSTAGAVITAAAGGAGQLTLTADTAGTAFTSAATGTNAATAVAQVNSITIAGAVDNGDIVRATINGIDVDYTVSNPPDTSVNDIRDGLIAAINANGLVNGAVTASAGGAGVITITSDAAGTAFTLASTTPNDPGGDTTASAALVTANVTSTADNTAVLANTTANGPTTTTTTPVTLTFDGKGQVVSPTTPLTIAATWVTGGTSSFALDLTELTQFAGPFLPLSSDQDGFSASDMVGITVNQKGEVVANFANSSARAIYKLPLALFSNANALVQRNGNTFAITDASGTARIVEADTSGTALFLANSREISNVDLGDQFTKLIMVQKAYNSSATVFKTVDELLQTARDLKR